MASVYYYKYYCHCEKFLFFNSDIVASHHFNRRNYTFIEYETLKKNILIERPNIVKCNWCFNNLGGMVYQKYRGLPDLVRICGHLIEREKIYLDIYRIMDENGKTMEDFEVKERKMKRDTRKTTDHYY